MIAGLSSDLTPHDVNQGDHTSMHVDLMQRLVNDILSRLGIDSLLQCFNHNCRLTVDFSNISDNGEIDGGEHYLPL